MMPPNKSEINGNSVGAHGRVNNVIQTIHNIINVSGLDIALTRTRIIDQFIRESASHQIARLYGPEGASPDLKYHAKYAYCMRRL